LFRHVDDRRVLLHETSSLEASVAVAVVSEWWWCRFAQGFVNNVASYKLSTGKTPLFGYKHTILTFLLSKDEQIKCFWSPNKRQMPKLAKICK
jgi:hypothetical protein